MKKLFNYILIACMSAACSSNTSEVKHADTVIAKDTMIAILVDINILEASINLNQVNGTSNHGGQDQYYNIFKRHNITRAQYDESLKEYSKDPSELSSMYDQVIEKLSKMQAEVNK